MTVLCRSLLLVFGLVACGHERPLDPVDANLPTSTDPKRLTIDGRTLKFDNAPVQLHGANLRDNLTGKDATTSVDIITADEADDIAGALSLDFVRLRVSFEGINRDDSDPTNLSVDIREKIDSAVALLAARRVWILVEMRTSDAVANDLAFYDPDHPSADFTAYQRAWSYLAQHFARVDYIAGYGLLAEPSPDKDKRLANTDVVSTIVRFQKAMADTVAAQDPRTPIFIGPAFNYDTLGYRWDDYATAFAAYRGRLVYEVNVLMPKPWIDSGLDLADQPISYPQAAVTEAELTTRLLAPIDGFTHPYDDEQIFSKQRQVTANFPLLLAPAFVHWYLGPAIAFADKWQVPMIVDQFGAAVVAGGQLDYERDVIATAEAAGFGWSRWLYNAYQGTQQERDIEHNQTVRSFYATIGSARPGP